MNRKRFDFPTPAVDDQMIYCLTLTRVATPMTLLALEIELFEYLAAQPATIEKVAEGFGITERAAEAMIVVMASLGFLKPLENSRFGASEIAITYLLKSSPFYRGSLFPSSDALVDRLRVALTRKEGPIAPWAVDISNLPPAKIELFINAMHTITLPAASALAQHDIFKSIYNLLDVGGGSGSLSCGIAAHHSHINCTILDIEPVCNISKGHIQKFGLQRQVFTYSADMFKEQWPPGHDAILFGNIFHDWDRESCRILAQRSYDTLAPGGLVILHEILLNDRKDGPLVAACFSVEMLLHEKGKQYTLIELRQILNEAGFTDVEASPSFSYYHIVTARKA